GRDPWGVPARGGRRLLAAAGGRRRRARPVRTVQRRERVMAVVGKYDYEPENGARVDLVNALEAAEYQLTAYSMADGGLGGDDGVMSAGSPIEWTERTWNPLTGCDRVSAGCDHCYALTMAKRLRAMGNRRYQVDGDPRTSGPGFGLTLHWDLVDQPLAWRAPS